MKSSIKKLYVLLMWEQYTQALKSEIVGLSDCNVNEKKGNSLWLLKNIKTVSTEVNAIANIVVTYHQQLMSISFIRPGAI